MAGRESHPIRNGVIAAVVGGVILSFITPLRELVWEGLKWLWAVVVWIWEFMVASYSVPGWLLLIFGIFTFVGVVKLYFYLRPEEETENKNYTTDMLYGANWRWSWSGNDIYNLWCFCPTCDATLVYDDSSCRNYMEANRTDFICERCGNKVIASIDGGNKDFAIGAADREIHRRIRTNEHISSNNRLQSDAAKPRT